MPTDPFACLWEGEGIRALVCKVACRSKILQTPPEGSNPCPLYSVSGTGTGGTTEPDEAPLAPLGIGFCSFSR